MKVHGGQHVRVPEQASGGPHPDWSECRRHACVGPGDGIPVISRDAQLTEPHQSAPRPCRPIRERTRRVLEPLWDSEWVLPDLDERTGESLARGHRGVESVHQGDPSLGGGLVVHHVDVTAKGLNFRDSGHQGRAQLLVRGRA